MTVQTSPAPASGATANQVPLTGIRWADLGRTGIIEDYDTTSWRVTSDGSSTTVTVGKVGDKAEVKGHRVEQTVQETVVFGTITVGQERFSRVVLRLNLSTLEASVTAILGTAATAGSAVAPSIVRNTGTSGSWDLPLALVKQSGTTAISQGNITDERSWTGPSMVTTSALNRNTLTMPLGSTLRQSGAEYTRESVNGIATWVNNADVQNTERVVDKELARVVGIEAALQTRDITSTTAMTVLVGSSQQVTTPPGANRCLVVAVLSGIGNDAGLQLNAIMRLVANGTTLNETRIRDRNGEAQGTLAIGGGQTLEVQVAAQILPDSVPMAIRPETRVYYRLHFS